MIAPQAASDTKASQIDVVIVGTGFGGLAMAYQLTRAGVGRIAILEKAHGIGGTWRDNRYPGAGCDVPSVLYSLSFAPKADWSRKYPLQGEIEAYLNKVADDFDIRRHVRFGVEVTRCVFDEGTARWHVHGSDGSVVTARLVVSAVGQLSQPKIPAIPGQAEFKGKQFHSARWDASADLAGRSVAVIGNGASAIQFLPRIAPVVGTLALFQRSPAWVFPKPDRPTTRWERLLFRYVPLVQRAVRLRTFLTFERGYEKYVADSQANAALRKAGHAILGTAIHDPALRRKLTPDYTPGCKRILISNEWYPAIARDNVRVVTAGVARFEADAVVDGDGTRHEVDAVIYATGFRSTQFLVPMTVTGRNGADLHERWQHGAEAYRGVAVPGFPNFFMMYGPNTNTHNSIIFMLESQARYIARKARHILRRSGLSMSPRQGALDSYYGELDPKFARFAWSGECDNWYRVGSGRVVSNWPERSLQYRRLLRRPDNRNYDESVAAGPTAAAP